MKNTGYILPDDKCTIKEINNDGTVKVEYPVSKGTKTAYAKSTGDKLTGEVYADDVVCIIAYKDERTQILYPISDGYKLGWIDGKYNVSVTVPEKEPEDEKQQDTGSSSFGGFSTTAHTFNPSPKSSTNTKLGSSVPICTFRQVQ